MKVKELYIKNYHQFEDFKLDLTYPEGYVDKDGNSKAGQPLDKICFIGQSGTGKTSLFEIIQNFIKYAYVLAGAPDKSLGVTESDRLNDGTCVTLYSDHSNFNRLKISAEIEHNQIMLHSKPSFAEAKGIVKQGFKETLPISIVYPVDFINNLASLTYAYSGKEGLFLNFGGDSYSEIWYKINQKITEYREHQIQKSLAISEITGKIGFKSEDILEAARKYQEWEQNNPNPLQDLADRVLDRILNKFNLRVRTRLDFEKIEDVKTIKIENLEGQEVPYDFQSTGTKQIFLSMLPLYTLKPNRTAIFFDEPERSLYPDIQKEIVDIYTSLTTDCQFFYATHSPIIASSFDPWEIVELKFNPKTGKVYQELYYEEERHVDNYKFHPKYLRWDDILGRIFDLEEEGNPERMKALKRLAILESKLKKNSISKEDKEVLWVEYSKLSKLTGWTTPMKYEKN